MAGHSKDDPRGDPAAVRRLSGDAPLAEVTRTGEEIHVVVDLTARAPPTSAGAADDLLLIDLADGSEVRVVLPVAATLVDWTVRNGVLQAILWRLEESPPEP